MKQIDHVNIVVENLPRMTAFYRDALGLRVTREVTIRVRSRQPRYWKFLTRQCPRRYR